jgi:RNA-binding protein
MAARALMLVLLLCLGAVSSLHAPQLRAKVDASRLVCSEAARPSPPELTGKHRRALRSHAGRLAAAKELRYVNVAVSERSANEVDALLDTVELVRCKFAVDKKAEAKVMASELAELTGAAVAEVLGHTALLYRPSSKQLISLD